MQENKKAIEAIAKIKSPFQSFGQLWKKENWDLPQLVGLGFDWDKMQPKVVYNKEEQILYGVYQYENGSLYYINEDGLCTVKPTCVIFPEDGRYYDENHVLLDEEMLFDYQPSDVCGEADDLSCYVYFDEVDS